MKKRKPKQDEEYEEPIELSLGSVSTFTKVPKTDKPTKKIVGFVRPKKDGVQDNKK